MEDMLGSRISRHRNVRIELILRTVVADTEHPYEWALSIVKRLYRELGSYRLIWGSGMLAPLRVCTYHQSIDHLLRHATFHGAG